MADELGCFLRDEPIRARPVGAPERFWRWCQRRPAVVGSSAALLLLVAVAIGSSRAAWRIATARDEAVRERDRAERTLAELELQRVEDLLEAGDSSSALVLLPRTLRNDLTTRVVDHGHPWKVSVRPASDTCLGRPERHRSGAVQSRRTPDRDGVE